MFNKDLVADGHPAEDPRYLRYVTSCAPNDQGMEVLMECGHIATVVGWDLIDPVYCTQCWIDRKYDSKKNAKKEPVPPVPCAVKEGVL
jgi:hypothetical protein